MSRNPKYTRLMSTSRWSKLRLSQLKRHPVCERCEAAGRTTIAAEVHHKYPLERAKTDWQMEELCFDPSNLMSVCRACHHAIHDEWFSHTPAAVKTNRKREVERFCARYLDEQGAGYENGSDRGSDFITEN